MSTAIRKANARRWAKEHGPEFKQITGSPGALNYPALAGSEVWANNTYLVLVNRSVPTPWGTATHLHIQRMDTRPVHKFGDLQAVKNALAGPEAVAVEMYPAQRHVVDEHHHYHLWVLPEGLELPFSINPSARGMS
jgi:hypothetical protein